MEKYMGFKLLEAEPVYKYGNDIFSLENVPDHLIGIKMYEGYRVRYPDGYLSFSPKEVFEAAYMKLSPNPNLQSGVSISEEMVNNFIVDYETFTKQDKITIVIATLANGFTIVESSACVDPANYDEKLGEEICKERIKNQVWNHLGFLLQTAWKGIK